MSDLTGPGAVQAVGIGQRFQPVPGARLVHVEGGDGIVRLPAVSGTPVHAVVAGMILDVQAAAGLGGILLRGPDGYGYEYSGLDAASITVGMGATVRAGDVVGTVGPSGLELRLTDANGEPADAVGSLLGVADPNELGYAVRPAAPPEAPPPVAPPPFPPYPAAPAPVPRVREAPPPAPAPAPAEGIGIDPDELDRELDGPRGGGPRR